LIYLNNQPLRDSNRLIIHQQQLALMYVQI